MKEFFNKIKRRITGYLLVAGLLVAIGTWPAIVFYPMGALLYRNDHPKDQADAVWLLMGGVDVRPVAAAKALLSRISHRIIFVKSESSVIEDQGLVPSEEELTLKILKSYGVDESKITVVNEFGTASSTVEEALLMRKLLERMGDRPRRIVVITSWPHSARAGWIIEKALSGANVDIEVSPVDAIPYDKSNWWKTERGLLFVFEEYIKWARYIVKYGARDLTDAG